MPEFLFLILSKKELKELKENKQQKNKINQHPASSLAYLHYMWLKILKRENSGLERNGCF